MSATIAIGNRTAIRLRCPACECAFPDVEETPHFDRVCPHCGFTITQSNGIFRALTEESKARLAPFVRDYEVVRMKEGWGSPTPDYYLALPFKDLTNRHDWIWRIRAKTLLYMQKNVLPKVESGKPCRILDIGAGNGWLSYRLAQRGYLPTAVDLLDNDVDGLGAAKHFLAHSSLSFPRFQAEMDHLPFDSGQLDVAIFNASFHYSADYERTLREVMRCVRERGIVMVADSPLYWYEESGQQMLSERRTFFEQQFGIHSVGGQHREYLTPNILDNLSSKLGIQWNVCKPWYGISWALRPVKARLLRRREPSKFYLLWFRV